MAIGVEGQYLFRFSLGGNEDFIAEDDLIEFRLVEEAGNVLPAFQLTFFTLDSSILGLLNENNRLQVSFGKDRDTLTDVPLRVYKKQLMGAGADKKTITVAGLMAQTPYNINSKIFISEMISAVEAINAVISQRFVPDFNITKSLDTQHWIQTNQSDKKFVNDMWLHADLGDSFPAVAISSDNKFILKDINTELNTGFKWRFTKNFNDPTKDIVYDDDYAININTGFINSWVGYGRERLTYKFEDAQNELILETIDPVVAITNRVARDEEITKRFGGVAFLNDNVHANYEKAFQHNLVSLAAFGTVRLTFSFQNLFIPIRPLDLVMFRDTDSTRNNKTAEFHSGLYFVCNVTRGLSKRQFVTTVTICRESLNELKSGL